MARALVVVFVPQAVSVRKISVADSYCNAFYFVLFFALVCLYVRGLACCFVRFFVSSLVCCFVISFLLALVCLFCAKVVVSVRLRCAMCVGVI